jgi:hypothetical protein
MMKVFTRPTSTSDFFIQKLQNSKILRLIIDNQGLIMSEKKTIFNLQNNTGTQFFPEIDTIYH